MRKLAILLLVLPALAQDDGTALFYKGFWLEQAEGKLDEAAALYGKLLEDLPDAPEAPRALLGLVRIKVARNEDAKEIVAELQRRYPAAKQEIATALRIVGERANSFTEPVRDSDSGVERKIKILYGAKLNGLNEPDRTFLIDLGTVGHPMLEALLRDASPEGVSQATDVLLKQRTPEAYAAVARALLDENAIFRSVIVEKLAHAGAAPLVLVEALEKLYERAPPRLRVDVVRRLANMAGREGDGRVRAFEILARALDSEDSAVRAAAVAITGAPDAYVEALLRRFEAQDPAMRNAQLALLHFADRGVHHGRIEPLIDAWAIDWSNVPEPPNPAAAVLLARRVTRELKQGNRQSNVFNLGYRCAGKSPEAATLLLRFAIETDDRKLVDAVSGGIGAQEQVRYLGDEAPALRAAAIAAAPAEGDDDDRGTAAKVIAMLGLGPDDLPAIKDGLGRRGGRRMPVYLFEHDVLRTLGAANAGALAAFCTDGRDVAHLLVGGRRFGKLDDGGAEFFRQVVPRAGPESVTTLRELAETDALAPLLLERLLKADGPEWGWTLDGPDPRKIDAKEQPGPYLWSRLVQRPVLWNTPALRQLMAARIDDPRREVALSAVYAAAKEKDEAALRRALAAERPELRRAALVHLATLSADAPAIVRGFAARREPTLDDRSAVSQVIATAKGPAMAALAGELLRADPAAWGLLWTTYQELAPQEAVELALKAPPTEESLSVLVRSDDPRRIEIFRAVLKGSDRGAIGVVLGAVHDQYLVELGEEALGQLRSPEETVRALAAKTIERLKFYAEARKAFEK